jgi:hypothetical protein
VGIVKSVDVKGIPGYLVIIGNVMLLSYSTPPTPTDAIEIVRLSGRGRSYERP